MSRIRSAILIVLLVLFIWAGAGSISFAVVELTGGGPQGEQGPQGLRGLTGPQGPPAGPDPSIDLGLFRLASMWAVTRTGEPSYHRATVDCIRYILSNIGSAADCLFVVEP